MLSIRNLTYRIGGRVLFDGASAAVNAGHRIGFVGRNGAGKTTLLHLIAGELSPDGGDVEVPAAWRVGMTSQEAPGGSDSLVETVLAADAELTALRKESVDESNTTRLADAHARLAEKNAHAAPARAAKILAGLGFDHAAQQRPCDSFSGGWRMRVALAGLLFAEPDLLLLDEPTNHLDLEATLWLEDYLRRYPGTVLIVSHDRDLLNGAVDEILHLENGKLTLYQGGYDRFAETRRMRLMQDEKLRQKQDLHRRETMAFVERFRAKASKAKQAQSRLKMLARMEPLAAQIEEGAIRLSFPEPDALPPPLLTLDDISIGYDGNPVLKRVSLRIDADDRIALLGANGNGKSTLIKLLAARLAPLSGELVKSPKLKIGYFAQHQADELDLSATPVLELGRRRPQDSDRNLRAHLGRFGFSQQRADTMVGNLSGGEKARLLIALMCAERPHLLLLDEPTNHLDMDTREVLIEAINRFTGAVILISHDPHILELTADRFWLVDKGQVHPFDGDLADYRALLLGRTAGDSPARAPKPERAAPRPAAPRPSKKRLDQAEARVNRLHADCLALREALAEPALYNGPADRLLELQKKLRAAEVELAAAEAAWMEMQEAADAVL